MVCLLRFIFPDGSPQTKPSVLHRVTMHRISHVSVDAGWPISVCPTLAQIYIILESFIKDPTNWHISKCQLEELEGVQQEVDQLMHFVQLEKSYAQSFWGKDPRRIEASTVHFYTFLQLLVRAVIPYPTMNLFECKTAHKLCIRISRL